MFELAEFCVKASPYFIRLKPEAKCFNALKQINIFLAKLVSISGILHFPTFPFAEAGQILIFTQHHIAAVHSGC